MNTKTNTQQSIFGDHLHRPEDTLTCLSYGLGQDSSAILYKLIYDADFRKTYAPGHLIVVTSDTGDEHKSSLEYAEHAKKVCAEHGIEFYHLTYDKGFHSDKWPGLREFYERTRTCGSKRFLKTCTDNLKIKPIHRFVEFYLNEKLGTSFKRKRVYHDWAERFGKVRMLIGIAAGEETRVDDEEVEKGYKSQIEKIYPLIDLGMDRKACQDYIASVNQPVPFPSNCLLCPFMSEQELVWLYRFERDSYHHWVRLEAAKLEKFAHKGDKNLTVWGKKTLPEKLEEALEKYGDWTDEELDDYKFSHGHCVKSKY